MMQLPGKIPGQISCKRYSKVTKEIVFCVIIDYKVHFEGHISKSLHLILVQLISSHSL